MLIYRNFADLDEQLISKNWIKKSMFFNLEKKHKAKENCDLLGKICSLFVQVMIVLTSKVISQFYFDSLLR